MILVIIALSMAAGLTFATFYASKRENRGKIFRSLQLSNRAQFAE